MRLRISLASALWGLLISTAPTWAKVSPAEPVSLDGGKLSVRPLPGMRSQAAFTQEEVGFFLGEIPGFGSASLVILRGPKVDDLPRNRAQAEAFLQRVASGLEDPKPRGAWLVAPNPRHGPGVEIEVEISQDLGDRPARMRMIQRHVEIDDETFTLSAVCLESSAQVLAPALQRSLASFGRSESRRKAQFQAMKPDERIQAASRAFAVGDFDEALLIAGTTSDEDPFPARVAGFRIRFSSLLALGEYSQVRSLLSPFMSLWKRDSRPFSAHYSWILRRGVADFLENLHRIERSTLPAEAKAALGSVALSTWAGPASQIPPRLTAKQSRFYSALKMATFGSGPAGDLAWQAIEVPLSEASTEIETFLGTYEKEVTQGSRVVDPSDPDFQWLQTSLSLPVVEALKNGETKRAEKLLRRFEALVKKLPGVSADVPRSDALSRVSEVLASQGEISFREYDYRLWHESGQEIFEETFTLLEAEGLEGLVEKTTPARAP